MFRPQAEIGVVVPFVPLARVVRVSFNEVNHPSRR
jgi:hypothetical protein